MYAAKNCWRLGWFFFTRTTATRLYWQIIDRLHSATIFTNLSTSLLLAGSRVSQKKYAVLESLQHGFRGSRSVQLVIQKECWLLNEAMKQETKLIRVDLDFKNAFNSAGYSSLWKILEGFGVPDVSLPSDLPPKWSIPKKKMAPRASVEGNPRSGAKLLNV